MTDATDRVLELLGMRLGQATLLKDVPSGNGNWLVGMPGGGRQLSLTGVAPP